jgi:hypothetical protein
LNSIKICLNINARKLESFENLSLALGLHPLPS